MGNGSLESDNLGAKLLAAGEIPKNLASKLN
jgi:hypothetical protein